MKAWSRPTLAAPCPTRRCAAGCCPGAPKRSCLARNPHCAGPCGAAADTGLHRAGQSGCKGMISPSRPFRLVYRAFDAVEFYAAKSDEVFELGGFAWRMPGGCSRAMCWSARTRARTTASPASASSGKCCKISSWWSTLPGAAPAA